MGDLEAQTDQGSSMSDSPHSIMEALALVGCPDSTKIPTKILFQIYVMLRFLKMRKWKCHRMVLKLKKKRSMLNRPTKVSFNLCTKF